MKVSIKMFVVALMSFVLLSLNTTEAKNPVKFRVKIENITTGNVLKSMSGETAPLAFAPGLWLVHTIESPLFKTGEKDWGRGLEALAEDGNPEVQAKYCMNHKGIISSGVFTIPVGEDKAGPITPGKYFEFTFSAEVGQKLTIAQMWGQSNDLFYAPNERGIDLFDKSGKAISGDITKQFILWDAGTEVNEEPGFGPNQGPRQGGMNIGPDEKGVVTAVLDGWTYPRTSDVIRITITPVSEMMGSK